MSSNLYQTLNEIVTRIRDKNLSDQENPLPDSDTAYKELLGDLVESSDRLYYFLRILNTAHYLFFIKIVEPDEAHGIRGIDGYVVAEQSVLEAAYEISARKLEKIYEVQFHQHKSTQSIIHEMFHELARYKNTPLGQALNVVVMLQQYQSVLREEADEYTEEAKYKKLVEQLPEITMSSEAGASASFLKSDDFSDEDESDAQDEQSDEDSNRRATDTPEYLEIENMDLSGKWGQAVENYGVQFLIRVHLRKNEYGEIKKLIKQHRIAREKDLRFLRDTLRKMEERIDPVHPHYRYRSEIAELRRMAQFKISQIFLARKELENH